MSYGGLGSSSHGEFSVHFASRRGGTIRAEEAAGITLLAVVLTALLILGCWFYRRRSGYRKIRNGQSWMRSGQHTEPGSGDQNKAALNELSNMQTVVPNAPPAYEKIISGSSPPPYSP